MLKKAKHKQSAAAMASDNKSPPKEGSPLEELRDKMEMSKKPKVKIMGKF